MLRVYSLRPRSPAPGRLAYGMRWTMPASLLAGIRALIDSGRYRVFDA